MCLASNSEELPAVYKNRVKKQVGYGVLWWLLVCDNMLIKCFERRVIPQDRPQKHTLGHM